MFKIRLKDKVMVVAGRDKGKSGEVIGVLPRENKVVIAGINTVKRHQKPTTQNPSGGIVELTKPIEASKVQVLDPKTGKPARVSFEKRADGSKERVFKVSKFSNKKKATKSDADQKKTDKKEEQK
ncbi:50S ribosomal protein L24 [bacterium]|nr:MAG: 50S ribosomal protein L24 [bacterium]